MDILNFFGKIENNTAKFFMGNSILENILIFAGIALLIALIVVCAKSSSKKKENIRLKNAKKELEAMLDAERKSKPIKEDEKFNLREEHEVVVYKDSKIADIIKIAENLKNKCDYAVAARMLENYSTDTEDILIKKQCDMLAVECLIYNQSYTAACEKAMSMLEAQYNLTKPERKRIMAMVRAMLEL